MGNSKKIFAGESSIARKLAFFIINDNYVFNSAITPKESKVFLGRVWVNSKTGKSKFNTSKVRLKYKNVYNGDGNKFPF